jgi:hypothetical protein
MVITQKEKMFSGDTTVLHNVQILPIRWKQDFEFEAIRESDETLSLEDITLKTVPGVRSLVNNVVVDGTTQTLF